MNPSQPTSPPSDARVACADGVSNDATTNKADSAEPPKLDDHGRGFVIELGGFYADRSGRKRGPVEIISGHYYCVSVDDDFGFNTFLEDGTWIDKETPHSNDLIAPWIDWKAECERLKAIIKPFADYEAVRMSMGGTQPRSGPLWAVSARTGDAEITVEHMRACIEALASLKGEGAGA